MLRRAVEQIRIEIDPGHAAGEVERTAGIGERVRAALEECGAEEARNLYERASSHLKKARADLDKGDLDRAVAEARIARNLFDRVGEISVEPSTHQ